MIVKPRFPNQVTVLKIFESAMVGNVILELPVHP